MGSFRLTEHGKEFPVGVSERGICSATKLENLMKIK